MSRQFFAFAIVVLVHPLNDSTLPQRLVKVLAEYQIDLRPVRNQAECMCYFSGSEIMSDFRIDQINVLNDFVLQIIQKG